MSEPRIVAPRVKVVVERPGTDELVEYVVQTDNRDAVRWDMARPRHNWPTADVAPMLWLTYVAWSALARAGDYEGNFETFTDVALSIYAVSVGGQPVDLDDLDTQTVGPTPPGPVPG